MPRKLLLIVFCMFAGILQTAPCQASPRENPPQLSQPVVDGLPEPQAAKARLWKLDPRPAFSSGVGGTIGASPERGAPLPPEARDQGASPVTPIER
jgi:hypothetical protein